VVSTATAIALNTLTAPTAIAADPSSNAPLVAVVAGQSSGYLQIAADGGVFAFGGALFQGSAGGGTLNKPVVAAARTKSGQGYWLAAADGGVFSFGDAQFYGSMGGKSLNKPIVGAAATSSGAGYWLVASDGGIFAFGDARFYGSMGGKPLNAPVVGMSATPSGAGYWLVASDGGIFAFGDAKFYGSMGGKPLNKPIVGIATTPSGSGYWLVASDGGIFAFGDAKFFGSMGGQPLSAPVVGIASTVSGAGYWLIGSDGGMFAFGNATFSGRAKYTPPATPNPTTSTSRDLAKSILTTANIQLQSVHASGVSDSANARQNVIDTSNGLAAKRSSYGGAPGGTIALNSRMLQALLTIGQKQRIRVSEISGGAHSGPSSQHYRGAAIDIDSSAVSFASIVSQCKSLGAGYAAVESTHAHCDWR